MSKGANVQNIAKIKRYLSPDKILPVYFLFGEDFFAIRKAASIIEKTISEKIESEFDKDVFSGEKDVQLGDVLNAASAYPFGSVKKLVYLKNYEKVSDKKALIPYVEDPPEFTVLLITNYGKITDFSKKPYNTMIAKNFLFHASVLRRKNLVAWVVGRASELGMKITTANAEMLTDITGYDRNLLEIQLRKILNYLGESKEITEEAVKNISSATKEYNIFDLLNAIGGGDKSKSLQVGFDLLDSGFDLSPMINMIAKYITVISQHVELQSNYPYNETAAAKEAGVSPYFYKNCAEARFMLNEKRLLNSARALFEADLKLKTSSADSKTILAVLLDQILKKV